MLPPSRRERITCIIRAYIVGPDGGFIEAVKLDCEHDAAAIDCAKRLVNDQEVELWQQDRMVVRLTSADPEQADPCPNYSPRRSDGTA